MKVIKLNRRYRMFKDHGHQAGLRFYTWNMQAQAAERLLRQLTTSGGWQPDGEWYAYTGKTSSQFGARPYFITVRDPAVLSAVLISLPADR